MVDNAEVGLPITASQYTGITSTQQEHSGLWVAQTRFPQDHISCVGYINKKVWATSPIPVILYYTKSFSFAILFYG